MLDLAGGAEALVRFVADSNEAIVIRFVDTVEDIPKLPPAGKVAPEAIPAFDPAFDFHPELTHQLFENERVFGYAGLRVLLLFSRRSLRCLMRSWHTEVVTGLEGVSPDDHEAALRKRMAGEGSVTSDEAEFAAWVAEDAGAGDDDAWRLGNVAPVELPRVVEVGDKRPREEAGDNNNNNNGEESKENSNFEVRVAGFEDPRVVTWHARLQIFVLFFVDGATYIDANIPRWLLFTSYEREAPGARWKVAAYATAYRFTLDPRFSRLRLSQIMTFPGHRGRGHAGRLFAAIHAYALSTGLREVTIEEPSEYLDRLRLALHVKWLRDLGVFGNDAAAPAAEWSPSLAEEIRKRAAIARPIARKCFEIDRLSRVDRSDPEAVRAFRVAVKKRMLKMFDADVRRKPENERRAEAHRLLKDAYAVVEKEYDEVIPKLKGGKGSTAKAI